MSHILLSLTLLISAHVCAAAQSQTAPSAAQEEPAEAIARTQPAPAAAEPAAGGEAVAAPGANGDREGSSPLEAQDETAQSRPEAPPPAAAEAEISKPEKLAIATWGGAYGQSQERTAFRMFSEAAGIPVEMHTHDGANATLQREAARKPPRWDVVDLSSGLLNTACDEGLVVKLPDGLIEADAHEDFLPRALHACGVGSVAWSALTLFDERAFPKRKPATVADLFDLQRHPGKRTLPRSARYTLEMALMADGVAPAEVYAALDTPEGLTRAFKRLDRIKAETIWWEKANEPLDLLRERKAVMGVAYNGRAFNAIAGSRAPLGMIWHGQVYDMNFWAIMAGSPHERAAGEFITFATKPESMAAQAAWFPYGPVRRSAVTLTGSHAELPIQMAPHLPTTPANLTFALAFDAAFWARNGAPVEARFLDWLQGKVDAEGNPAAATPTR
jgi:putative spermidine/putrescine transport system substrate-binding protein